MRLISLPKLPRRHLLILPPLLLLAAIYLYLHTPQKLASLSNFKDATKIYWPHHPSKFWHSFAPILAATAPKCPPPSLLQNATASLTHVNGTDEVFNLTTVEIACLHRSHTLFVDLVNFGAPHLDFKKRTKGITTLASKSSFPVLLVNIFMLRRTGSTLPVEIFLETEDDYEPHMCDGVFADWGAKCIILSSLLRSSNLEFEIARPQLWIFAVMFSSSESVLFLEGDSFLLRSPDELFDSELFTSDGLVLWPSVEDSSVSPQISEVIELDEDILSEIPAVDHRQILISKKRHANTLSLAAYHSIYEAYYGTLVYENKLMSLAAAITKNPYHKVKQPAHQLGSQPSTSTVLQFDPTPNLNCTSPCTQPVMSIHTNWLSSESKMWTALGSVERLWGTGEDSRSVSSKDIEAYVWKSVVSVVCRMDMPFFASEACERSGMKLELLFSRENAQPV